MLNLDHVAIVVGSMVITYFFLSQAKPHTVATLTLITIFAVAFVAVYLFQSKMEQEQDQNNLSMVTKLEKDIKEHTPELPSEHHYIDKIHQKVPLQFLKKNKALLNLLKPIAFLRLFDKHRFTELTTHLDRMQKIYMYILGGRHAAATHLSHFLDMRDASLRTLHSMIFIVPPQPKHLYGVNPFDRIKTAVAHLTALTRTMVSVIEVHASKTSKNPVHHLNETDPMPADEPFDFMKARTLP